MQVLITLLKIAGSVALFLYGIKKLSDGLQKTAGKKLKKIMKLMTRNRFSAVLTGIFITVLINSSSATSVMVVSFVNAGLMNLSQAIGVIFGANIGTTITGWLVALFGFSIDISSVALCAVGISLPFLFMKNATKREIGELILGFGLLFIGLDFVQASMPDISDNLELLSFLQRLNSDNFLTNILCILIGVVLTILLQSSAASMAITLTLAYQGWIGVYLACSLILGQNIGTTFTAFLASRGTNTNARRAAAAHTLFNLFGTFISILLLKPMIYLINLITPGDIYTMTGSALSSSLPIFLSMFHSLFNIMTTLIFLPFINQFGNLICKLIKEGPDYDEDTYHFKYVKTGLVDSNEVYLLALIDEIKKMANIAMDMLHTINKVYRNPDKDMGEQVSKIKKQEDYADQMQEQLTDICVHLIEDTSSTPTSISSLVRVIDEIESITDSCCNIIMLCQKKYNSEWELDNETFDILDKYQNLVIRYMEYVLERMNKSFSDKELKQAEMYEKQINEDRNAISTEVYDKLTDGGNVSSNLWTLDMIRHLEHIGDFCTNIAESYHQVYKHTPTLRKKTQY